MRRRQGLSHTLPQAQYSQRVRFGGHSYFRPLIPRIRLLENPIIPADDEACKGELEEDKVWRRVTSPKKRVPERRSPPVRLVHPHDREVAWF